MQMLAIEDLLDRPCDLDGHRREGNHAPGRIEVKPDQMKSSQEQRRFTIHELNLLEQEARAHSAVFKDDARFREKQMVAATSHLPFDEMPDSEQNDQYRRNHNPDRIRFYFEIGVERPDDQNWTDDHEKGRNCRRQPAVQLNSLRVDVIDVGVREDHQIAHITLREIPFDCGHIGRHHHDSCLHCISTRQPFQPHKNKPYASVMLMAPGPHPANQGNDRSAPESRALITSYDGSSIVTGSPNSEKSMTRITLLSSYVTM